MKKIFLPLSTDLMLQSGLLNAQGQDINYNVFYRQFNFRT